MSMLESGDNTDTWLNRATLRRQYRSADHLFVHTEMMKDELSREFQVDQRRVPVIPFGINNSIPVSSMTRSQARQKLGVADSDRVLLFFGNIAPYKGFGLCGGGISNMYIARSEIQTRDCGQGRCAPDYWTMIQRRIHEVIPIDRVIINPLLFLIQRRRSRRCLSPPMLYFYGVQAYLPKVAYCFWDTVSACLHWLRMLMPFAAK